jgi:hypothetical protein
MIRDFRSERGVTLIETAIASAILLIAMIGLMTMAGLATMYTENHGHLEARTTEYAQDKMEQLLALAYNNSTSDTVHFPAPDTGGTGLSVGGSTDTAAPVNGYVDWLAQDGTPLFGGTAAPANWFYERVWKIEQVTAGLKRITVVATVRAVIGGEMRPKSAVIVLKSSRL